MSDSFTVILASLRAWVESNFEGRFKVDRIEINPVIFETVQQAIKKDLFAKNPVVGDLGREIYSIEGIKVMKSKDPFSGIHFRFKEAESEL